VTAPNAVATAAMPVWLVLPVLASWNACDEDARPGSFARQVTETGGAPISTPRAPNPY
jgi:hypothetical protein